ncbi:hypothetical protein J6590_071305 [Homalodisca vitripennis]|nr:hypothetical protein J6590_071305 [Homalodisca vitripennis]
MNLSAGENCVRDEAIGLQTCQESGKDMRRPSSTRAASWRRACSRRGVPRRHLSEHLTNTVKNVAKSSTVFTDVRTCCCRPKSPLSKEFHRLAQYNVASWKQIVYSEMGKESRRISGEDGDLPVERRTGRETHALVETCYLPVPGFRKRRRRTREDGVQASPPPATTLGRRGGGHRAASRSDDLVLPCADWSAGEIDQLYRTDFCVQIRFPTTHNSSVRRISSGAGVVTLNRNSKTMSGLVRSDNIACELTKALRSNCYSACTFQ